jgi:hypothetical protein
VRKLLIAAVAAAVAVGGFAVFATAGVGPNNTSWNFAFKPLKKAKSAGTISVIEPAQRDDKGTPDDESDDTYLATKKTTITFTKGSRFNTAIPPRCNKTAGEVAADRGASCTKALVGGGAAESVFAKPGEPKTGQANASIKAYNKKNGIYFLIQPCQGGTNPCTPLGNPFVLVGTLKYKDRAKTIPQLVVPTPRTLLDLNIVITKFSLTTKNITKRVAGKIAPYVVTPGRCGGKWASSATANYTNGSSLTIKDTMPCT